MTAEIPYLTALVASVGRAPTPQDVVDALVPEVADLAQLFLRVGDALRLVAFHHIDPEQHPILEELANVHRPSIDHPEDPVARVIRTGLGRISTWVRREDVERATKDTRVHNVFDVLQPRSVVIVPLSRDGNHFGALVIAFSTSRRQFVEGDLEFMREFAARVGPAIRVV